jgi:hypothetical protein
MFALIWTHDQPVPRAASQPRLAIARQSGESQPIFENKPLMQRKAASVDSTPFPAQLLSTIRQTLGWDSASREWKDNQISRYSQQILRLARGEMSRPVSQPHIPAKPIREIPRADLGILSEEEMPLPAGIAPGEYRAVSNTGIVRHLTLTWNDLQTDSQDTGGFTTRDIYQSESEKLRWYFIRVQSNRNVTIPVIAERGRHITLPALAERPQSEGIQRQAGQIIVKAGQRMANRLIRMMRSNVGNAAAPAVVLSRTEENSPLMSVRACHSIRLSTRSTLSGNGRGEGNVLLENPREGGLEFAQNVRLHRDLGEDLHHFPCDRLLQFGEMVPGGLPEGCQFLWIQVVPQELSLVLGAMTGEPGERLSLSSIQKPCRVSPPEQVQVIKLKHGIRPKIHRQAAISAKTCDHGVMVCPARIRKLRPPDQGGGFPHQIFAIGFLSGHSIPSNPNSRKVSNRPAWLESAAC